MIVTFYILLELIYTSSIFILTNKIVSFPLQYIVKETGIEYSDPKNKFDFQENEIHFRKN